MKQMKINVPEGHEIDTERSDLSTGEIYFREKKPDFKVGDWVICPKARNPEALQIEGVDRSGFYRWDNVVGDKCYMSEITFRHATTSEIAEAKERLREKELPKRWKDLGEVKGFFVDSLSCVSDTYSSDQVSMDESRNTWPTREEAEASIALAQLCQLRDAYNGCKYSEFHEDDLFFAFVSGFFETSILGFKTSDLRDKFNSEPEIQKLIEKAKPLL